MSMPSIADVKAAADIYAKYPPGTGITCASEFERFDAARELLAKFALAVLSAPGITSERLEEIEGAVAEHYEQHGEAQAYFDAVMVEHTIPELLAEILRLLAMTC